MNNNTDINGLTFKFLRNVLLILNSLFFSFLCIINAKLRNIKIGKKCKFYGMTYFQRKFNTNINIGNNCRFRSSFISNLIGINRKCILATHYEGAEIRIGDNCGFSGTVIGAAKSIVIENYVMCGANVLITDFDWHNLSPVKRRTELPVPKPILIEDNVFIGTNSVVLKGVHIGQNSVVGANSVVTTDVPPNVVAAGNPCRVIKSLVNKENI